MGQGTLVGIVTSGDIKRALILDGNSFAVSKLLHANNPLTVGDVMTKKVKTVTLLSTISETINIFLKNKILGVPVVSENGDMVGIITKSDIFNAFISLTSMDKKGIDIGFQVVDRAGSIKEITDIIRKNKGRITSIMSSYDKAPQGYRYTYVRASDLAGDNLTRVKQEVVGQAKMLYVVDIEENKREIFDDA